MRGNTILKSVLYSTATFALLSVLSACVTIGH